MLEKLKTIQVNILDNVWLNSVESYPKRSVFNKPFACAQRDTLSLEE